MAASSSADVDTKRWVIIYPAYLNSTKTIAEGRKIPKETAVENPTLAEIVTCVKNLGLLCIEEPNKAYSRDPIVEIGRIRIELKKGNVFVNPEITSRTILYKKVAQLIPTLTSRQTAAKRAAGKAKGKK